MAANADSSTNVVTSSSSIQTQPFSSPIPGLSNLSHVAIKLDRSNYVLWKSQLLPILYGTDMLSMVDGTIIPPKATITEN